MVGALIKKHTTLFRVIEIEKPANNGEASLLLWYNKRMGNTVGSTRANFCNFYSCEEDAYILGLWCADSYWWSSSIGLSNTDPDLIERFRAFFERHFPKERIKFNDNHLFVNSRPLLREFVAAKGNLKDLKQDNILKAYFAGRFDGDGSIAEDLRSDCRIVYGSRKETEVDRKLLNKIGISKTSIYYYRTAKTFCLYISRYEVREFLEKILPYSTKLQKLVRVPRRDLTLTRAKRV